MTKLIRIIDTTLREGEQTPGITFTDMEKREVVNKLILLGVHEVELGISSPMCDGVAGLVRYCRDAFPQHRFSLWARCMDEDIRYAGETGVEFLSLSIPVSDVHLDWKVKKDRKWVGRTIEKAVSRAVSLGMKVSLGFEDATRADEAFLLEMTRLAERAGVSRIRLADTVGISSPMKMAGLVSKVAAQLKGAELGVHTHNDFGMAVGNAVAAIESGAGWVDGAVLGLGERAGCASLEQLIGYLVFGRKESGIDVEQLKPLVDFVAGISNTIVDARSPILGESIFTCETGLHVQGLMNRPETYEPFAPDKVGAKRKLLIGEKTGKAAMVRQLQLLGRESISDSAVERCVEAVRVAGRRLGRGLSSEELLAVCRQG